MTINYVEGRIATGSFILLECAPDFSINYTVYTTEHLGTDPGCSPKLSFYGVKNCTLKVYDQVNGIVENNSNPAVVRDVTLTGAATQPSTTTKINTISTTIIPTMTTKSADASSTVVPTSKFIT